MKSFEIEEIKDFINDLLAKEKYDSFYLYDLRLRTSLDYYINGKINKEFYDDEEKNDITDEYVCWGNVKHTVFELIKGKNLPLSFKIILMFNRENVERLIMMNNLPINFDDVGALFYNIYYENGSLSISTGVSLKYFTLDKTLEQLWDETVEKYYI